MTKFFKNEFHAIRTLNNQSEEAITDSDKANILASQFEKEHSIDLINNSKEQKQIIDEVEQ